MKDLYRAIRVTITVRSYLKENNLQQPINSKQIVDDQERMFSHLRQIAPIE